MSLPYFFFPEEISGNIISLPEDTARHCVQVLRMKAGEALLLTDGMGNLYNAIIESTGKKTCTVSIEKQHLEVRRTRKVCIAISPLKNPSRFEWFLEKATEIGVSQITPLICNRTERQPSKAERMQNILISAILQSRQTWLPQLTAPVHFETLVVSGTWKQKLIAHCEQFQKSTLSSFNNADEVQILIGPEGDFTTNEIEAAIQQGYQPVSLGNTRLRSETAGIVAATLLINS